MWGQRRPPDGARKHGQNSFVGRLLRLKVHPQVVLHVLPQLLHGFERHASPGSPPATALRGGHQVVPACAAGDCRQPPVLFRTLGRPAVRRKVRKLMSVTMHCGEESGWWQQTVAQARAHIRDEVLSAVLLQVAALCAVGAHVLVAADDDEREAAQDVRGQPKVVEHVQHSPHLPPIPPSKGKGQPPVT